MNGGPYSHPSEQVGKSSYMWSRTSQSQHWNFNTDESNYLVYLGKKSSGRGHNKDNHKQNTQKSIAILALEWLLLVKGLFTSGAHTSGTCHLYTCFSQPRLEFKLHHENMSV